MCDDGCKRIDQARFVMAHTGVLCSSALKGARANWFLIMISTLAASLLALQPPAASRRGPARSILGRAHFYLCAALLVAYLAVVQREAEAQQQGGVYDFGQGRAGEKRGNLTPSEVVAIILVVMLIVGGLALTVGLCFYVTRRARQGLQPVKQVDY